MAKDKKPWGDAPEKLASETAPIDGSETPVEPKLPQTDDDVTDKSNLQDEVISPEADKESASQEAVEPEDQAAELTEESKAQEQIEPGEARDDIEPDDNRDAALREDEAPDTPLNAQDARNDDDNAQRYTEQDKGEAETTSAPQDPPAPVPAQQGGSIWPAVIGGVIAAMIGFIAGRGDQLDAYLPASMQRETVDIAPVVAETSALAERLEALENAPAPDAPASELDQSTLASNEALEAAMAQIEALNETLSGLNQRIDEMESRPVETVETVVVQPADNSEEVAALQSSIENLEARISADEERAKSEAERVLAQAALTRVVTAVDSGDSFEPALSALEAIAPVDVPEALRLAAAEGVPTLSALRESFPQAARAGLAAARADVPELEVAGIGNFLRRQLSVRSVTPREGDDPDAILSRAEAAVNSGNLDRALGELDALPQSAKAAMQGWFDGAAARQAARDAAQTLSDSLTVN
ncbi:hypothetical protein [Roseobacter fucihabitans]|uniref:hypothetical protein n=1 Tax=Roseobacter fucihabitans TaxID=1537242 RepID=UPI001652EC42|nr:hypothetical protein [Roseobacter litoralis]